MKAVVVFIILLVTKVSIAQTASPSPEILLWVSCGIGGSGLGTAAVAKVTTVWDDHSISGKFQHVGSIDFGGGGSPSVQEYSLYYGRQKVTSRSIGRIAAGPGLFQRSGIHKIGVGIEAEVVYIFHPFGLGLMGSLMVAKDILYPSITLNFSIGKLRAE